MPNSRIQSFIERIAKFRICIVYQSHYLEISFDRYLLDLLILYVDFYRPQQSLLQRQAHPLFFSLGFIIDCSRNIYPLCLNIFLKLLSS